MGRHQRAETSGLISFLICAVVGAVSMNLYMEYAPAIWQLTQRRFMVCSGIVAACGVISFIIGYARKSRSLNLKHGWFAPIRRIFEIVALSVVYASTIFLSSFALIGAANDMMGNAIFSGYISSVCAAFAGVVGYMTCTGGDDERQNYCQSVAVLRHLRRGHRRHDHRRPILLSLIHI